MGNVTVLIGGSESIISQLRESHTCISGTSREDYFSLSQLKLVNIFSRQEIGNSFAKCVYYEQPIKEKNQEEFVDTFVKKILHDIRSVKDNYSDIRSRQVFLYQFKQNINALWDFVSEDDFSENLVMVLTDSIKNLRAENIKRDQLDAIKDVIEAVSKGNITEEKLDFYMKFLIEKDIPLVRLPANISDLYD